MTDKILKILLAVGLALHLAALGLGLAGCGWRWPLVAAVAPAALVILGLSIRGSQDTFKRGVQVYALAVLGAAGLHAASAEASAAWALRIAWGAQTLLLALLLLFFLTFRLTRLW